LKETLWERSYFLTVLFFAVLAGACYHLVLNYDTFYELLIRAVATEKSVLLQPGSGYQLPTFRDTMASFYYFEFGESPLFIILFLAGLPFLFVNPDRLLLLLLLWLGGMFVILVFVIKVTMPYYLHPALPVIALISAGWLRQFGENSLSQKR
jgi:hypothetical protein